MFGINVAGSAIWGIIVAACSHQICSGWQDNKQKRARTTGKPLDGKSSSDDEVPIAKKYHNKKASKVNEYAISRLFDSGSSSEDDVPIGTKYSEQDKNQRGKGQKSPDSNTAHHFNPSPDPNYNHNYTWNHTWNHDCNYECTHRSKEPQQCKDPPSRQVENTSKAATPDGSGLCAL